MAKHKILSVPVVDVDAPKDASWMERYIGIIEFAGIAVWILHQVYKPAVIEYRSTILLHGVDIGVDKGFPSKNLARRYDILNLSHISPYVYTPVFRMIQIFCCQYVPTYSIRRTVS